MNFPPFLNSANPRALERWIAWLLSSEELGVYSLDEIRALERWLSE